MITHPSIWQQTQALPQFPAMQSDIHTQVLVVGAGMAGLCTAHELMQRGYDVALIDAGEIAHGATAGTTGKITLQHGTLYQSWRTQLGDDTARELARANARAVQRLHRLAQRFDCDLSEQPAILYAATKEGADLLMREREAYQALDIPFAQELPTPSLDLPHKAVLCVPGQYMFHPLQFVDGLVREMQEGGVCMYAHTRALELCENGVRTDCGTVKAEHIVISTHYPFVNIPGFYFIKMEARRDYAIAFAGPELGGMYISAEESGLSLRNATVQGTRYVLSVGAGHKTGEQESDTNAYEELLRRTQALFGKVEVAYRWSAQDCMPFDKRPYIGRLSSAREDTYVITGFQKWGMAQSALAAEIIADAIEGKENDDAALFDPARGIAGALFQKDARKHIADIARQAVKGALQLGEREKTALTPGTARIFATDGVRLGVYCDENGALHGVKAVCPHLGCALSFNPAECTWDCTCHGSRFAIDGTVLEGPAQTDLQTFELA